MNRVIHNREHWLTIGVGLIDERITAPAGYAANVGGGPILGSLRISVGNPSKFAFRRSGRALAETFDAKSSTDGTTEIFISPYLDEAVEVLATVVHELGHAALGAKAGHNEHYVRFMRLVGLIGIPTATLPSTALSTVLRGIADELGPYPHGKLDVTLLPQPQSTRLLKCICINDVCPFQTVYGKPYNLRITWQVASQGTPKCGVCEHRMGVIKPSGQKGGGGGGGGGTEEPGEEPEVIVIDPFPPPSAAVPPGWDDDDSDTGGTSEAGDNDADGSGDAETSDGSESDAGENEGGDEGEDALELSPDSLSQATGERTKLSKQAPNPEAMLGGGSKGKGKVGRAEVSGHAVKLDCDCTTCEAQRKDMGI